MHHVGNYLLLRCFPRECASLHSRMHDCIKFSQALMLTCFLRSKKDSLLAADASSCERVYSLAPVKPFCGAGGGVAVREGGADRCDEDELGCKHTHTLSCKRMLIRARECCQGQREVSSTNITRSLTHSDSAPAQLHPPNLPSHPCWHQEHHWCSQFCETHWWRH
jgi:hypothetical protein